MRLGTFGTDLDRLVNFRDEWKISSFGGFWHLRVGIVLDGCHAQGDRMSRCVTLFRITHVVVGVAAEKRGITVNGVRFRHF